MDYQGDVAGEDHQVGPGDLPAVLLLDRPQQPAGLVGPRLRPAVERREALLAAQAPPRPSLIRVRAGSVPGHPDDQQPSWPIGRPPVLGVRQHRGDVAFHLGEVEGA